MKDLSKFTHYGKFPFFGLAIPILYNESDENIAGTNWFYDVLLDFAVWIQFEFDDGFHYWVSERITDSNT